MGRIMRLRRKQRRVFVSGSCRCSWAGIPGAGTAGRGHGCTVAVGARPICTSTYGPMLGSFSDLPLVATGASVPSCSVCLGGSRVVDGPFGGCTVISGGQINHAGKGPADSRKKPAVAALLRWPLICLLPSRSRRTTGDGRQGAGKTPSKLCSC